jgi:hypothetical protein
VSKLTCEVLAEAGLMAYRVRDHSIYDCYITPAGLSAVDSDFARTSNIVARLPPVEITESLGRFWEKYPDASKLGFVMMRFGKSKAHTQIYSAIRDALASFSLKAVRADDMMFHDDLFSNILTYVYGCQFGIAVFERIEDDTVNPNVSLEVGYMLGLGKSVCFLKDHTQKTLQTDLIGKMYLNFDPQSPEDSIPNSLFKWLKEKKLIPQSH